MAVHKNDFSFQFHRILKLKEQQKEITIRGRQVFLQQVLRFANYERCMVKSKEKRYLDLWNKWQALGMTLNFNPWLVNVCWPASRKKKTYALAALTDNNSDTFVKDYSGRKSHKIFVRCFAFLLFLDGIFLNCKLIFLRWKWDKLQQTLGATWRKTWS